MAAVPPPLPQDVPSVPPPLPVPTNDLKESNTATADEPPRKKRKSRFDDRPPAHELAKTIAQRFDPGADPAEIRLELEVPSEITRDRQVNFVGMMIGPGGMTQRQMETASGARINVRGQGSSRSGQDQDPSRPMYVLIRADSQAKIDVAAARINELLYDKNKRDELKREQMRHRDASAVGSAGGMPNSTTFTTGIQASVGGGVQSETLMIPASKVGIVIGRGGETIQAIQRLSGAHVQVQREHAPEHPESREIKIQGTYEQIVIAKKEIQMHCAGERTHPGLIDATDHVMVPNNVVGIVIGRGGETIKQLQAQTGCTIQVTPEYLTKPEDDERKVNLSGNPTQCQDAKDAIAVLVDKHRDTPYIHAGIGHDNEMVSVPAGCIGILIGKGGENVKMLAQKTRTRIQVQKEEDNPSFNEETAQYRHVLIRGDKQSIEEAKGEIQSIIDEHAARHGYDAPQLGKPMHQMFGMDPQQYRLYLDQMQQYYGMDEQQVVEYYKAAVEQMTAAGQAPDAAGGEAQTSEAATALAQAQQAQALAYQAQYAAAMGVDPNQLAQAAVGAVAVAAPDGTVAATNAAADVAVAGAQPLAVVQQPAQVPAAQSAMQALPAQAVPEGQTPVQQQPWTQQQLQQQQAMQQQLMQQQAMQQQPQQQQPMQQQWAQVPQQQQQQWPPQQQQPVQTQWGQPPVAQPWPQQQPQQAWNGQPAQQYPPQQQQQQQQPPRQYQPQQQQQQQPQQQQHQARGGFRGDSRQGRSNDWGSRDRGRGGGGRGGDGRGGSSFRGHPR